jgi:hypothetical protein
MIRVTVELVPHGDEEQKVEIGTLVLANTGAFGLGLHEYHAVYTLPNVEEPIHKVGPITHCRQDGFWVLIKKILQKKPTKRDTPHFDQLIERL